MHKFFYQFICKHLYSFTFFKSETRTVIVLECTKCNSTYIYPVVFDNMGP